MSIPTFQMTLLSNKEIAPQIRHLTFKWDGEGDFQFIPGQFITIHFEHEGKMLRRSYSVATVDASGLIEFAAGYFPGGPASELLFNLKVGEQLATTGPFGRLILKDDDIERYVFIATGTGVTPFRSMLPELAKRMNNNALKVSLSLGVQRRNNLLYGDEFIDFANKHENFDFRAFYSREALAAEAKDFECEGYVQTGFGELNLDPQKDIIYLCGNPNMIDEAFATLKEMGFGPRNVRREKYISS